VVHLAATDDLGPPVLTVSIEGWVYDAVRHDLTPLLVGLGKYLRRTRGAPMGAQLRDLLAQLERRAEIGIVDQGVAVFGSGRGPAYSKVMTVQEVSQISGRSERSIRELAGNELPGRRSAGGAWLLEAADVRVWLREKGA
jgi:hypothetical protein